MKTLTIKALFNIVGNPFCLDPTMQYPTIEGSTANFLTYYNTNRENLDRMFVHDFGQRLIDFESSTNADIEEEWYDEIKAIQQTFINNWARLWYALEEPYNPLYNVDGVETTVYGTHITSNSDSVGQKTDTSTLTEIAYNSGTEKQRTKQTDVMGAQSNSGSVTSQTHTDTVTRQGNIGTTKSTDLLTSELRLRADGKSVFFKVVFQTMIEEIGAYYDNTIL